MLIGVFGGLGLFLYGMQTLSDGLQKVAGDRLRRLLEVLTRNPLTGVIMGTVVTAILQSSSATTVMIVGFVNAGLMTLRQAAGVIMGANVGTTVTAQIIALDLSEAALPATALGVLLIMFSKNKRTRYVGQALVGFGLLFLGMTTMSTSMKPLADMQWFTDLTARFAQNPFLGVLAGIGLTGIVQSSSATIGILQGLAREGAISLQAALPVLFGDNIGTTVTALLASIGTSLAARRAAVMHTLFNVIGTIIFLIIFPLVVPIVLRSSTSIVQQIANAHTGFNVANTLIQLPFIGVLVLLVTRLIPGETEIPSRPHYLDRRFLHSPAVALQQARKHFVLMGQIAKETVHLAAEGVLNNDDEAVQRAFQLEQEVNQMEHEGIQYLLDISKQSISDQQSEMINMMLNVANDLERIGDHGENIGELALEKIEAKLGFSEQAQEELVLMRDQVLALVERAVSVLQTDNKTLASNLYKYEEQIDELETQLRNSHMARLNAGACLTTPGIIFLDVISNLERVADHASNIGNWIIDYTPTHTSPNLPEHDD
ncbi:MAG: Na/Pi cotransporter family protein [Firmicutes bacterium]|nr:Na/Pi cotransporter family protein [Bacillota bacterium]